MSAELLRMPFFVKNGMFWIWGSWIQMVCVSVWRKKLLRVFPQVRLDGCPTGRQAVLGESRGSRRAVKVPPAFPSQPPASLQKNIHVGIQVPPRVTSSPVPAAHQHLNLGISSQVQMLAWLAETQ